MNGQVFRPGSVLHLVCLLIVLLAVGIYWLFARRWRDQAHLEHLRRATGLGCVAVWLINTLFWATRQPMSWEQAIPLHYCNMANLIAAIAILGHRRVFQGLLYFWAFGLCIWAFLTPTVQMGYLYVEFWIFWLYHLFIGLGVVFILVADRFRPNCRDLGLAMLITAAYTFTLAVIDYITGWNYGFVGPSKPDSPTIIDGLGPYPLRLLWMALLAAGVFILLQLPFYRRSGSKSGPSNDLESTTKS